MKYPYNAYLLNFICSISLFEFLEAASQLQKQNKRGRQWHPLIILLKPKPTMSSWFMLLQLSLLLYNLNFQPPVKKKMIFDLLLYQPCFVTVYF